jgi:hypothetical protein
MSNNTKLSQPEWYVTCLTERKGELFPLLDLSVVLHALTGLPEEARRPRDLEEARNYRLFAELTSAEMLSTRISGTFKPSEFIHPFENHYSLPGYLDAVVLPYFADAVDTRAAKFTGVTNTQAKAEFLAFVYMYFLLVHPFVDRNGRVARSLLDYYYRRLFSCTGPCPWRIQKPKFATRHEHAVAFQSFFKSIDLPERPELDPYPIPDLLRSPLRRMADHLIEWANSFRDARHDRPRRYHEVMTELFLQN